MREQKGIKKLLGSAVLAGALLCSAAGAAGTPAGTTIENTAYITSLSDDGVTPVSQPSNPVSLTVRHVPAILITPDGTAALPGQTVVGQPGQSAVLSYTLTNPSNGSDSFTLALTPGQQAALTGATIYMDTDGDGKYTAGTDKAYTGAVPLAADGSTAFFVVYQVPAAAPATDIYDLTPTGATVATNTQGQPAVDVNNLGRILAADVLQLSLTADQTGKVTSPGSITYTHTLTNTGNGNLAASQIALTKGTIPGGWSYSYSVGGATQAANPQQAVTNWGGTLAPGQSVTVAVTVNAPTGLTGGAVDTTTVAASITTASTPEIKNNTSTPVQVSDTTTVIQAIGSATKSAESCGTDATCASPSPRPDGSLISPLEYIRYTVISTNSGTSGLIRPVVRDTLPAHLKAVSWTAVSSQPGTVLYSLDNVTWSATAPSIAGLEQQALYVGLDTNADGTMSSGDSLIPGSTITMRVTTQVK